MYIAMYGELLLQTYGGGSSYSRRYSANCWHYTSIYRLRRKLEEDGADVRCGDCVMQAYYINFLEFEGRIFTSMFVVNCRERDLYVTIYIFFAAMSGIDLLLFRFASFHKFCPKKKKKKCLFWYYTNFPPYFQRIFRGFFHSLILDDERRGIRVKKKCV